MTPSDAKCSILIPTFNGRDILAECLPSVVEEVKARGWLDEIIVIDNASTDDTVDYLKREFSSVRIVELDENKAIFALNIAAEHAQNPYLFFLNNDMILEKGCIERLLSLFKDDVFAVTGIVYQWDRQTVQAGRRRPVFQKGYFWYLPMEDDNAGLTLHALGGQSIFDRKKFLEIGGLDSLFEPFYHEDLDISWRALRRGWRILYVPEAVMYHRGAATAGRIFTKREISTIMQKNMFLFMWKNLHDPDITRSLLFWTVPRLLQAVAKGDLVFLAGFARAIRQLPEALLSRRMVADFPLSDKDVFSLFDKAAP